MVRQKIPQRVKNEILFRSKRRCPFCFVEGKTDPQSGVIAHLDSAAAGLNDIDNLVYLCTQHHAELDRGHLNEDETRTARSTLYAALVDTPVTVRGPHAWHVYEERVVDFIRAAVMKRVGDYFSLARETLYRGRSGVSHQIDLAVEFNIAGLTYLTVFEIKLRKSELGADDVLSFAGVAEDIGANKGVIVCNAGFSTAAMQLARAERLALLQVPDSADSLGKSVVSEDPSFF